MVLGYQIHVGGGWPKLEADEEFGTKEVGARVFAKSALLADGSPDDGCAMKMM